MFDCEERKKIRPVIVSITGNQYRTNQDPRLPTAFSGISTLPPESSFTIDSCLVLRRLPERDYCTIPLITR